VQGAPPLPPGASLTLRGPAAGDCGGRRHGAAGAARQPAGGPALGPRLGAQVERPRGPLRRPRSFEHQSCVLGAQARARPTMVAAAGVHTQPVQWLPACRCGLAGDRRPMPAQRQGGGRSGSTERAGGRRRCRRAAALRAPRRTEVRRETRATTAYMPGPRRDTCYGRGRVLRCVQGSVSASRLSATQRYDLLMTFAPGIVCLLSSSVSWALVDA